MHTVNGASGTSLAACVLILADHSCFDYASIVRDARMVFDVRNATRNAADGRLYACLDGAPAQPAVGPY